MASFPKLPIHSKATSVALLNLSSSSLRALGVRVKVRCSTSALCRELQFPRSTAHSLVRRISSLLEGGTGEETCPAEVQVSQNKLLIQVLRYQAVAILRLGGCIRPKDHEHYLRRGKRRGAERVQW